MFLPVSCKIHVSRASVCFVLCCFLRIRLQTWWWHGSVSTSESLNGPPGGALLSAGGLDVKSQEAALRAAPDILIATPGRLIDHLHNCPSFHLSSIEVLILDEADRYIGDGGAPGILGLKGHTPRWEPAPCVIIYDSAITIVV